MVERVDLYYYRDNPTSVKPHTYAVDSSIVEAEHVMAYVATSDQRTEAQKGLEQLSKVAPYGFGVQP